MIYIIIIGFNVVSLTLQEFLSVGLHWKLLGSKDLGFMYLES